jgi:RecT family
MTTQRQIATTAFNFIPQTFDDAMKYATLIANSGICPENFRGRPSDVLIVTQLGNEVGFKPLQALRAFGVVNGIPFAYGDGLQSLVKQHAEYVSRKEWFEGSLEDGTLTAFCAMTRRGEEPVIGKFSMNDAKRAGLWAKKDNWNKYPMRMLQHRARTYAARDAFPDATFNILTHDEVMDMDSSTDIKSDTPIQGKGMSGFKKSLGLQKDDAVIEGEVIYIQPRANLQDLLNLISRLKVTKGAITVTLKRYGAESYSDLTDEQIEKWSNHLKAKEQQNDRS